MVFGDGMKDGDNGPHLEMWAIDRVKPYEHNPRTIPDKAVAKVAGSLKTFGFQKPIVVDEQGIVIAGHVVLKAAQQAGFSRVPVLISSLDAKAAKAYRIADNRTAQETDWLDDLLKDELTALDDDGFDLDSLGFDDRELQKLLSSDEEMERAEETPEAPVNPVTIEGDVWVLGNHRIICGDSTKSEDLDRVGAVSIDCVFTSPPYAVGIDYGVYQDTIDNLRKMLPILASEWMSRVVPGGFAITNFGDIVAAQKIVGTDEPCEYPMALEYWPVFRAVGWALWTRRIWKKPHARVHSPWVIQSSRAAADWEHVWVWKKSGNELTGRGHGVDVGKSTHGAGMPVAIAAKALETYARPKKLVLEPFSGTGTTLVAAEITARACCAVEINPAYVDVSVERWCNFTGLDAIHEASGKTFAEMKAAQNASVRLGDREGRGASGGSGLDTERLQSVPVGSGASL